VSASDAVERGDSVTRTSAALTPSGSAIVTRRGTNLDTGEIDQGLAPCGHTLASVCPVLR